MQALLQEQVTCGASERPSGAMLLEPQIQGVAPVEHLRTYRSKFVKNGLKPSQVAPVVGRPATLAIDGGGRISVDRMPDT